MEELKKQKQMTIVLAVMAGLIIGATVAVNIFYFEGIIPGQTSSSSISTKLLNSQKEFKQIQEKLLQNEKFNELQKLGEWPLKIERMMHGKDNPFNGVTTK